jgi:LytR cell envelope-related transcriptional attenuator
VDTRLPSLDARPWRTATLVASAVAALELVLLVIAGAVLLARPLAHRGSSATPSHAATKPKPVAAKAPAPPVHRAAVRHAPRLSRARTSILVLNGNGQTGAAGAESARVTHLGYHVARVGDAARMDYPSSVVMYRPGFEPEGRRLAHDLSIKVVGPLDGVTIADLGGAQAAVVVGH